MKVRLKPNLILVTAESAEELEYVARWASTMDDHVFALKLQDGQTFRLTDLGPRPDACRAPINVTSRHPDPAIQLISNFAHTPFELDGQTYGSIEAFWQGLKYPEESRRREIAPLFGQTARHTGFGAPPANRIEYRDQTVRYGTTEHWRLMTEACAAKFNQHPAAHEALLSTGERPLIHKTRRDSRSIPGVVMADIWMTIRRRLIDQQELAADVLDQLPPEPAPGEEKEFS